MGCREIGLSYRIASQHEGAGRRCPALSHHEDNDMRGSARGETIATSVTLV